MANDEQHAAVDEKDAAALAALIEALGGRDRKARQASAHTIVQIARVAPAAVAPFAAELAAAVERPEAQTRWESLDALTSLVAVDPQAASAGFDGAESCLFDEESGLVRLTAFRYFTALGAVSGQWARAVWPLVDEALQCYHGDPEFDDMLDATLVFAHAVSDEEVCGLIAERMSFDAKNGKGPLSHRARQIVDAARKA